MYNVVMVVWCESQPNEGVTFLALLTKLNQDSWTNLA